MLIDNFFYLIQIDVNQLNRILEITGYPTTTLLAQVNEDARHYLERNEKRNARVNFTQYFHQIQTPSGN